MGWILTQVLEWPLNGAHVRLISVAAQGFEYGRDKTPEGSLEPTSLFGKMNTSKISIDLNNTQSLITLRDVQDETLKYSACEEPVKSPLAWKKATNKCQH